MQHQKNGFWKPGFFSLGALLLLILGVLFWRWAPPVSAATGINEQINFQGKVVNSNGTNVANASYTFLFCFYTTATPTTACTAAANNDAVWRESKSLSVTDGVFQTNLGDTTTLPGSVDFNTDNIYLGINFNADGQMTPLIRMTAVPQAFNADNLDGLDSTAFGQLAAAQTVSGGWTFNTAATTFTTAINANGGLTTSTTDQALNFTTNGAGDFVFTADANTNLQINYTTSSDDTINVATISLTNNAGASTGTLYGLNIINNDNAANTGVPDALARLANANAAETVANGLLIEQTAAGTLTNGIQVTGSAGTIASGLLIADGAGAITDAIALTGTFTNLINTANLTVANSGNIDTAGTIQAGSSNVNLTLATGFIDADAITLATAGAAKTGTSSGSGLSVYSDGLSLLRGCADRDVLAWNNTAGTWGCTASGGSSEAQVIFFSDITATTF